MSLPVKLCLIVALGCRPTTPAAAPKAPDRSPRVPDTLVDAAAPEESAPTDQRVPNPPLAIVGNAELGWAEFEQVLALKTKKYSDRGRAVPHSAVVRYRRSIAERLVHAEQVRQHAEDLKVEFDPADLAEREAHQRRGIRDFAKHLERRGETEESLRHMYETELLEREILVALQVLLVTDAEVLEDYEKIKGNWKSDKPRARASHILIPTTEPNAKARAKKVHKLATAKGADFAAIAAEHSTGPSAGKGGDVGIFTPDRMAAAFSDVVFRLKLGQISKPLKTKFGWHIVKLTGKWPPGDLPIDALRDQIIERLEWRKLHQGRSDLKDELAEQRPVQWFIVVDPTRHFRPTLAAPRKTIDEGQNLPERIPLD